MEAGEARCLANRGYLRTSGYGQLVAMTPDAEEALRLARVGAGDPTLLADALVYPSARVSGRCAGVRPQSVGCSRRALRADLARRTHAGLSVRRGGLLPGQRLHARGAYEDALPWYQQLSAYASTAGRYAVCWLGSPTSSAASIFELFDLDEALSPQPGGGRGGAAVRSLAREPHAHSLVKAGLAYLYRGEHGPAEACLRRAEALLEADTWLRWRWQIALLHAWGELALAQGHPDQAWTYTTQSLALARPTGDSASTLHGQERLQGAILAARGRLEEAVQSVGDLGPWSRADADAP